jgi:hypothetical protein
MAAFRRSNASGIARRDADPTSLTDRGYSQFTRR